MFTFNTVDVKKLMNIYRYGIASFVYSARQPFDPSKLYHVLEGKFILLQDEAESDDEDEDEDEEMSDADSDTDQNSHSATDSNQETEDEDNVAPMDSSQILANKKACPYFRGLHRSKGMFWLATRPYQMGSWSTAGAMLTLGSEMPWFCTVPEEEWMANDETTKSIKADFEGQWGDRRQEIVFIGEKLDVKGLTKLLDGCLLGKKEMKQWEKVMQDDKLSENEKEEKLQDRWDDSCWAEWQHAEDDEHNHDHYHA
jgi:G3E family GTPase